MMHDDERENIKRSLYRDWWKIRNLATVNNEKITYNQRFAEIHGETLEAYHARLRGLHDAEESKGQA